MTIKITNLNVVSPASFDRALAGIKTKLDRITEEMENMNTALQEKIDELAATVAKLETAESKVIAFAQGVPALIQAAVDAAMAKGVTAEQLQELTDLKVKISADADALAAAIVTPPAEPTDPTAPGSPE